MDKLTQKIIEIQNEDWINFLDIPWVFTFKNIHPQISEPVLYQPSMIFISSWSKTIKLDKHTYKYWEWKFLLVSLQTSFICESESAWRDLFAGIHIDINKNDLYDLVKQLKNPENTGKKKHNLEPWVLSLDINEKIYNALLRLLECSKDPEEAKILWPAIIKEIMFYAIQESDAQSFCDLVLTNKNFWPFEDMLDSINKNYKSDISIDRLAEEMNMSIPTFYRQFKAFTWFSPNQYIKNLRLSMAKRLLMSSNYNVKQAAGEVWYNSQSQFSREYKRYFWYAPALEQWL